MTESVLIKKYENRRLYDTHASRYINLEGVAELVREGHELTVVDAKTGEDLTRQVLTQIIVETARDPEGKGPPLEFLRDLVRASDRAQRDFFQWYLSAAHELYRRLQENWQGSARGAVAPWQAWAKLWDPGQAASLLLKLWSEPRPRADRTDRAAAAPQQADPRHELDALRARLDELERRLATERPRTKRRR